MPIITPNPTGYSIEGYPIYIYEDDRTHVRRYVVHYPNGLYYYCDARGRIGQHPNGDVGLGGAFLGGLVGLAFGGAGAIIGAIVGALVENVARRNR